MKLYRVGTFFMLVGLIILMLFVFAVKAGVDKSEGMLLWGLLAFALGAFLYFRFPKPPPEPSGRFRILKKGDKRNQPRPKWEEEEQEEDR
ncbi:MAG: hypothetical protein WC837_10685 [Bellilinea sp.]